MEVDTKNIFKWYRNDEMIPLGQNHEKLTEMVWKCCIIMVSTDKWKKPFQTENWMSKSSEAVRVQYTYSSVGQTLAI